MCATVDDDVIAPIHYLTTLLLLLTIDRLSRQYEVDIR